MKNSVLFGVICCALASMSWGAMFPVANGAFQHINPFYFTLIRYLPVTLILIFFLLKFEGKEAFRLEEIEIKICSFATVGLTIYNIFISCVHALLYLVGVVRAAVVEALHSLR